MRLWLQKWQSRNEGEARTSDGGEVHRPADDRREMSASDAPCAQECPVYLDDEVQMWEGHLTWAVLDRWLEMAEKKRRELYGDGLVPLPPNDLVDELHLSIVAVPLLIKHLKETERWIVRECIPE